MRLAALLAGFALLAGGAASAQVPDDLGVPVILSLTGTFGFYGQKEQATLQVLQSMVNARGGVNGRHVRFDYSDDESNPQVAVQLVNALIAKKVPLILGPGFTATCQAVSPLVETNGPVSFCLSPAVFPKPGSYVFMSTPSFDDVEPVVFRYLLARKWTKIAIITVTDASGSDFEKRVDGVLTLPDLHPLEVVAREHFGPTDISVAAQMTRIKAAAPDVIVTFTSGTPFGTLLRGIHDAGIDAPVYGSGGNFTYTQMHQYAAFLPKELILNGARGITEDPTATGAVRRAQDEYQAAIAKAGFRPEFATLSTWDPMLLSLEALRRAGPGADAQKVHEAFEGIKGFSGIEGTYDFTTHDQHGVGPNAVALFRYIQAKDIFVQVYPATGTSGN
jgi:branched-chain amino acid transport system substrate-binding protein